MTEETKSDSSVMDAIWEKVSSRLGGTSQTVQKIKFGRGAVGKISVITVATVAAIAAMAVRLGANAVYVGIGAVTLVALGSFGLILYIVCKRPELAVMEGAELVQYQHFQLAAKGYTPSPENPVSPSVGLATTPTPQIESEGRQV